MLRTGRVPAARRPTTRPDYGIIVGRAKACTVTQRSPGAWTFTSDPAILEIGGSPLTIRLLWKDRVVLRSITDEQIDQATRLPTLGRLRQGGLWSAAFSLASGEPVYGLGEKFGPLDKRGQLIHSQVQDAQGVNTGLAYKNAPFAWSPGTGNGAWGSLVHTPGMVTHGVGHPDWSHRSYAVMVEDEALDLFVFAGDTPAAILDLYTQLTGRPAGVPRWSLGLWVARASYETPQAAIAVATRMRERKVPADVLTLDAATAWDPDTRFDFTWDPARYDDPAATLATVKALDFKVCVHESPHVSVNSPLFQELASREYLLQTSQGDPLVHGWSTGGAAAATAGAQSTARERLVDFTNPDAFAVVARPARDAVRIRRRRRRQPISASRCRMTPSRSTATPGPGCTMSIRCFSTAACSRRPRASSRRATGRRSCGAAQAGPAASVTRSAGAAIRKATGKDLPRPSAADCRGA